jgi:ribonuclease J
MPHTKKEFSIVPIGGIGEIGKNCTVFEHGERMFVIDCGLSFPDYHMFGIDVVIPDFTYIVKNQKKIKAIIFTHGHEDHIGSIPYLLTQIEPVPIYATRLTLGLIENKLAEWNLVDKCPMMEIEPGKPFHVDGITVDAFRVTHSIPDSVSLAFHTPAGIYLHSGDFKIDPHPIDGKFTDETGLAKLGKQGVLLLLCDVTNVERTGHTGSESAVGPALRKIFTTAPGRIFTTTFASNIHRVQQVIDLSAKYNRKVALVGRSMVGNGAMARELGYLKVDDSMLIDVSEIDKFPQNRLSIIVTGSQGEPMSALSQIARDEHRVRIVPGDLVIFSASPIPGNETAIYGIINDLFKKGAHVVYGQEYGVHVSGHGSQDDITKYIGLVKPQFVMPVHGQYRHQMRFMKLAADLGYPSDHVIIGELGDKWTVSEKGAFLKEKVKAGVTLIDGISIGEVGGGILKERLQLAEDGMIVFSCVLSKDGRRIIHGPEIFAKGFLPEKGKYEFFEDLKKSAEEAIFNNRQRSHEYRLQLRNNVANVVKKTIFGATHLTPVILVLISYVDSD